MTNYVTALGTSLHVDHSAVTAKTAFRSLAASFATILASKSASKLHGKEFINAVYAPIVRLHHNNQYTCRSSAGRPAFLRS